MILKFIAIAGAVLLCVSALWSFSKSAALKDMLEPRQAAKPIVFDNGSVGDARPASDTVSDVAMPMTPGLLRKCQRGEQVSYTNLACPAGFKEKTVGGPPINVLAGQSPPRQAAPSGTSQQRGSLRDALDLRSDENLRAKVIERAVEGPPR